MSEYFGTTQDWLNQTVLAVQQVRDQRNVTAMAAYKQAHDDWVKFRVGDEPQPPGSWVIVNFEAVIDGVKYVVPQDDPVYRPDIPLCEPLPVPEKPDLSGLPGIGTPFYPARPKWRRRIIGRARLDQAGKKRSIAVDGETVEYFLEAYPNISNEMVSAWWEPVG